MCKPPEYVLSPARLGEYLRGMREKHAMGLTQASRIAGISRSYLWGVERGRQNITVGTLVKLANAYSLPPSEIVFAVEDEQ